MPSPFPSSFASAAAGNSPSEGSSNHRTLGRGDSGGDWSRARTNGATQTFRRQSQATNLAHSRETSQTNNSLPPPNAGVYVPPHLNSNYQATFGHNGAGHECRYSKDQILDIFKAQGSSGRVSPNWKDLFVDGWDPRSVNGSSHGGWGRRDEHKDSSNANGPEICWDHDGQSHPLSLVEMDDEEKEAFATSVNSPLKPPIQNATKDNIQNNGSVGRRTSVTQLQASTNAYSGASPSTRLGMRRRDTSESLQLSANTLVSPNTLQNASKEESDISTPPPSLLRRRTDLKDGLGHHVGDKDKESKLSDGSAYVSPFGALKRTATGPVSAGLPGPSSPWSAAPQSAGYAPMGAFGNFSLGGVSAQPLTPGEKKGAFGSLRGESRFKGLMGTVNSDEADPNLKLKASLSSLDRMPDTSNDPRSQAWSANRSARPLSTESNPFGEDQRTGSAALGGDDVSPPYQRSSTLKYPNRQTSFDEIGFSSIAPSEMPPFRDPIQRRDFPQHQYQAVSRSNEPLSPTYTNPYQSPEIERALLEDLGTNGSDINSAHIPAVTSFGNSTRTMHSQFESTTVDRSHTSSAGPGRNLPLLGNLGAFGGLGTSGPWSAASGAIGTPTKTQSGYSGGLGDSIFGPLGEVQSPGQAAFYSAGFFGGSSSASNSNTGTIGRGSKMGSLFPAAMQEQMRGDSLRQESEGFQQMNQSKAPIGMNAPGFGNVARDTDSSSRQGRGMLDDLFGSLDLRARGAQAVSSPFATSEASDPTSGQAVSGPPQPSFSASSTLLGTPAPTSTASGSYLSRSQDQENIAAISSQIPATQQRQMVMPDRMRWIYRDPQGNTQGPWSGLEMHDWYKAGFFSPELQVKKLEDADYEPLAQLIRRIGNSREPFLVPQIGIPHGSSAQASSIAPVAGNITATAPSAAQIGSAQPPFASSFPSFGTTLTAEQQNALERRKQEEQYLMARQKEHLAQQQVLIKQMQHMQGGAHMHGQQLHHHSSAHSLQSQPSYGSITSPTGYQPSPAQGPIQPPGGVPGFYEAARNFPSNQGPLGPLGPSHDPLGSVREEDIPSFIEKFSNVRTVQQQYSSTQSQYPPSQQESMTQQQQIATMLQDRARLQREQEQYDMMQRNLSEDPAQSVDRLAQYHQLRAQADQQQVYAQGGINDESATQPRLDRELPSHEQSQNDRSIFEQQPRVAAQPQSKPEPPSLSEQVQRAAALAQQEVQPQSPWAKVDTGLPQPFPPQSSSPLPAPAARRNRQNVADTLAAESRSETETPSVETPSAAIAPWAKDNNEALKGPSLKEIQEAEALKAAQQEEIAVAARKAAAEQERQNQVAPIAPVAGLPSSSKWASSASPAIPTSSGPSPWAKPKATVVTPVAAAKKTLAQIQKEEEARKQRVAASAAATAVSSALNVGSLAGGKRYADLAGKVTLAGPTAPGGAWTTVGSSGKVKAPTASTPATAVRVSSGGAVTAAPVAAKPILTPALSKTTGSSVSIASQQNAHAEFKKWAKGALSKGLNSNINVDDFVSQLLMLPPEPDILSEAVHSNSTTLNSRHFADEFIRHRKAADKGVVIPDAVRKGESGATAEGKAGGWSEIAKKGTVGGAGKEEGQAFRVVAGKKRGKR